MTKPAAIQAMRPILAVLLLLMLFWAISLERTYAYLGLQSTLSQHLIAQQLHPLSVDFGAQYAAGLDWRRRLIGTAYQAARFEVKATGLQITAHQSDLDLRFAYDGARLNPATISSLRLRFGASARPKYAALAVHADPADAGWIAELGDSDADMDLNSLVFMREPQRVEHRRWQQLPELGLVRLYLNVKPNKAVELQQLSFVSAGRTQTVALSGAWPPKLLASYNAWRSSGERWPLVHYRGLWLGDLSLSFTLVAMVLLAAASQLWFWRRRNKAGAAAAICLCLSFLPALVLIGFDLAPGASHELGMLAALPVLSFALLRFLAMRGDDPISQSGKESTQHAVLISLSLGGVAWLGMFGLGSNRSELDLRMAMSYLLFAGLQQVLLQALVVVALEHTRWSQRWVVLFAAGLFALWHAPNLVLMLACFVAALLWCAHFLRYRRLTPLVLSHALLGWWISVIFPELYLRSAKIGVMYFW